MNYTLSDWPVRPMEPQLHMSPFDDPNTLFQVKWDGVRVLSYRYPDGRIRLFNRRLNERTLQYPELTEALSDIPKGTVLDGEIVALGPDGKPDFHRVLRRDLLQSSVKTRLLLPRIPVSYMAFDILWLNGKALYPLPLCERLKKLEDLPLGGPIHLVDSVRGAGKALFEAVHAEGLEGIVAKKSDSSYRIGQKTPLWQKIKNSREITGLIGGYLINDSGAVRSLLVGLPEPDGLFYVGAAASGLTQAQLRALTEILPGLAGGCPFTPPPFVAGAKWVEPTLGVRLRFLEYTSQGAMRAPVILSFPGGFI